MSTFKNVHFQKVFITQNSVLTPVFHGRFLRESFCRESFCRESFCRESFCRESFCRESFCIYIIRSFKLRTIILTRAKRQSACFDNGTDRPHRARRERRAGFARDHQIVLLMWKTVVRLRVVHALSPHAFPRRRHNRLPFNTDSWEMISFPRAFSALRRCRARV